MSIKYAIDTSAWIEYFNGSNKKISDIIENSATGTPLIVIAELSDKFCREKIDFREYFNFINSKSKLLQLSLNVCMTAGQLKTKMRKERQSFGLSDALIYLTSIENGSVLVTKDLDFTGMDKIILI